ncbi:MAG: hypothetical protein M0026_16825 [Nocardiopsaceae bacterium]|nr:hypothetical protein [Nocardiopsaceae bacterium]
MRLTVVVPLADPTLRLVPEPDGRLLDLNACFVRRLSDPWGLRAHADTLDTEGCCPDDSLQALFARAAAALLERPGHGDTRLRALACAMRLTGSGDPAITVTLDELALRTGSTQSLHDIAAAAARAELFGPEAAVLERAAGAAEAVEIIADTDRQLPAALVFARAVRSANARAPIELCGRSAAEHASALRALCPQNTVRGRSTCGAAVHAEWTGGRTVHWITGAQQPPEGEAWAGWLDPADAARIPPPAFAHCRALTLTMADMVGTAGWDRVVGGDGTPVDLGHVGPPSPGGPLLAADILVGAPGTAAGTAEALVRRLLAERVRIAGFRRFRASGASEGTQRAVDVLLGRYGPITDCYPARVAAASLTADPAPRGAHWDPAATVVPCRGAGPDGRGPGDFAVSLRTGRALRAAPGLAPLLRKWNEGISAPFDGLPVRHHEVLGGRLLQAGIVRSGP